MTHICPYCGGKMDKPPPEFNLTIRQGIIYNLIVAAGPEGVSIEALKLSLFKDMSAVSIRSMICRINKIIDPQRIMARNKTYFIQV